MPNGCALTIFGFISICFHCTPLPFHSNFDDADEYCPHCDNKYVIEAEEPKDTTKVMVMMEMEDARTKNTQLSPEEEAELNSLR